MRKIIYVAGPLTAATMTGVKRNIAKAAKLGARLFDMGWSVIVPHTNTTGEPEALKHCLVKKQSDATWQAYMDADFAQLERCDAIIMLEGSGMSRGARAELQFAAMHGIPVFHAWDKLPMPDKVTRRWK